MYHVKIERINFVENVKGVFFVFLVQLTFQPPSAVVCFREIPLNLYDKYIYILFFQRLRREYIFFLGGKKKNVYLHTFRPDTFTFTAIARYEFRILHTFRVH